MQITRITKYTDITLIKLSSGELLTERMDEAGEEAAEDAEEGEEDEEAEPEAEDGR